MNKILLTNTVRNVVGWLAIAASLVLLAYWVPNFVLGIRNLLLANTSLGIDEHLIDVKPGKVSWLLEQNGGRWGRYGWHLASGERGELRIALPGSDNGILKLRLRAYNPGQLSVQVDDGFHLNDIQELSEGLVELAVRGKSQLLVKASNAVIEDQLVLNRFTASWSPSQMVLPSLLPFGIGIIFILVGWGLLCHSSASWRLWLGSVIILVAMFAGLLVRWSTFDLARFLPLNPDTTTYMGYANSMKWFTSGHGFYSGSFGQREPLFVALLHMWFVLMGNGHASPVLFTVLLSTLLIVLAGYFA